MTERLQPMRMVDGKLAPVEARIWYRVEVPPRRRQNGRRQEGFVCGIETDQAGTVVTAAPIMRWAIGKDIDHVANWVLFQGGTIEPLDVVAREEP